MQGLNFTSSLRSIREHNQMLAFFWRSHPVAYSLSAFSVSETVEGDGMAEASGRK